MLVATNLKKKINPGMSCVITVGAQDIAKYIGRMTRMITNVM